MVSVVKAMGRIESKKLRTGLCLGTGDWDSVRHRNSGIHTLTATKASRHQPNDPSLELQSYLAR